MRALTAFALGAAAAAVVTVVALAAVGAIADAAGWRSFSIGLGGPRLFAFDRSARGTATTFGPGVLLVAAAGGALNAAGAIAIGRRVT